jgi:membrane protein implicated in regulation of membrane protease activity
LFALVAFAGWYLYRRFIADALRVTKASAQKRKEEQTGAVGTLVRDPSTGEYRVKQPD